MKLEPKLRETFDQTFMERLALVRVQVLDAKPPELAQKSQIAKMFFWKAKKACCKTSPKLRRVGMLRKSTAHKFKKQCKP